VQSSARAYKEVMSDNETQTTINKKYIVNQAGPAGAVYGLGFLGALIYFWQHSPTFWLAVLGFFKALVWPALLVYKALALLGW
jgi:hypothetical protein